MTRHDSSAPSSILAFSSVRDVWLVWIVLVVLTTLPYVTAALRTPKGHVFTSVLTAYDDTFTYFAWIRQGADGHLLMCDLFTSEPQSCEFFLPVWNVLGLIARVTGMHIALTFHAARLLATLVLLVAARAIVGVVMKSRSRVRYSLWLYAMSAGFGWLVYALKNQGKVISSDAGLSSVDLNMPEAIAFRSVFAQVQFVVGAALVFGSINLLFKALLEKKAIQAFISGALVTLLAVVHPYLVVVVCAVAGAALLMWPWLTDRNIDEHLNHRWTLRLAALFGAAAIPGVAYLFYLNRSSEVLREWLRVTDTLSPAPWEYVLGFGIIGLLAALGFRVMWSSGSYGRLLLIWAVVQAVLLYAPLSFQRRLVEGLQLPLSIAASLAVFWIADRFFKHPSRVRYRSAFLAGVIVLASITNLGFFAGQMIAGAASGAADQRRYVPRDLVDAFEWLGRNAEPDAVLFSSYLTGNIAPSMTGLRVFLGHYGLTVASEEKGAQVTAFYIGALNDEAARQLFEDHRVRYVIYGPFERAISDSFVPPRWLALAHRVGEVEVFAVTQ